MRTPQRKRPANGEPCGNESADSLRLDKLYPKQGSIMAGRTPNPGDKFMFFAPTGISVAITPNCQVSFGLGRPHPTLGFDPAIVFAMEMSPTEARTIGEMLIRKAAEAEERPSRH